jgi:hypothetical protein
MKDPIKQAFERAIAEHKLHDDARKIEQKRVQTEREKFEAGWSASAKSVSAAIDPATKVAGEFWGVNVHN